jgi:hypothetical protein
MLDNDKRLTGNLNCLEGTNRGKAGDEGQKEQVVYLNGKDPHLPDAVDGLEECT